MYILNRTTNRWASHIHKNTHTHTFRHTFHHILTFRYSVFPDYSSTKQEHVLSVPECGALDIDCQAKTDVSECGEAGHVVEGLAWQSADCKSDSPDIFSTARSWIHPTTRTELSVPWHICSCCLTSVILILCWLWITGLWPCPLSLFALKWPVKDQLASR